MNFNRFSEWSVEKFANAILINSSFLIFQHIPKTAGTSLIREMRIALHPYKNLFPQRDEEQNIVKTLDQVIAEFLENKDLDKFRSVSGHLSKAQIDVICAQRPNARVFTFLRDPLERVISEFRYCSSPVHLDQRAFVETYPSFDHFIDAASQQNRMWQFLSGEEISEGAIKRVFRDRFFIGLLDDLDLHFQFVSGIFGCPKPVKHKANITQDQPGTSFTCTDAQRQRILENNAADIALYDAVKRVHASKRAELQEFVRHKRSLYAL